MNRLEAGVTNDQQQTKAKKKSKKVKLKDDDNKAVSNDKMKLVKQSVANRLILSKTSLEITIENKQQGLNFNADTIKESSNRTVSVTKKENVTGKGIV